MFTFQTIVLSHSLKACHVWSGLGWSICGDKEFALASGRVPCSLHCTHKLRVQVCNDGSCLYELSGEGTELVCYVTLPKGKQC